MNETEYMHHSQNLHVAWQQKITLNKIDNSYHAPSLTFINVIVTMVTIIVLIMVHVHDVRSYMVV